ncbi:MAG: OB-fold domain-containing protein [Dehalococcoidia bacterium]|nr:MAG: OB-fold domain-containing protein [Dehalococcoidia bacterium]
MVMEYIPGIPILRPYIDLDNQGFWDAVKQHKLVFQKCKDCGLFVHRPRPMCPRCLSTAKEWVPSEGKGKVYCWVNFVYANAAYPGIKVPYPVVVVELTEGVRMISNVHGVPQEEIYIGMPVEVVYDDVADDLTLPKFKKQEV